MQKDNDDLKDYRRDILETIFGSAVEVLSEGVANVTEGISDGRM